MTLSEAAEYIKQYIPTEKVISLYGYSLSRGGFMRCPFHSGDHTASLKVYDASPNGSFTRRGWYCFGCHAGGSVIDFVMQHESCTFANAVRAIDHALGLHLLIPDPDESDQDKEVERLFQSGMDRLEALLLMQIDDEERFLNIRIDYEFKLWLDLEHIPKENRTAAEWTRLENLKSSLEYMDYKLSTLDEKRKEVREWRNSYRFRKLSFASQKAVNPCRKQTQMTGRSSPWMNSIQARCQIPSSQKIPRSNPASA